LVLNGKFSGFLVMYSKKPNRKIIMAITSTCMAPFNAGVVFVSTTK
jgi:hypothetical protein